MFCLTGLVYMLQEVWLPVGFRLTHGLELAAGSFTYAWALAWLLTDPVRRPKASAQAHNGLSSEPAPIHTLSPSQREIHSGGPPRPPE